MGLDAEQDGTKQALDFEVARKAQIERQFAGADRLEQGGHPLLSRILAGNSAVAQGLGNGRFIPTQFPRIEERAGNPGVHPPRRIVVGGQRGVHLW